ncbi:MAG: hypothetical protein II637_03920, partial [Bacteroidales bacterium]|nr:hypothetical protein [Bacteroidales bacterium]
MRLNKLIAATALTVVMVSSVAPLDSYAQSESIFDKITQPFRKNGPKKKNKDLKKENERLQAEINALRQQLNDYIEQHEAADSIAAEMIEIYEENEDRIGAGIAADEYTPEVTDSLLNLWYSTRKSMNMENNSYNMDSVHFTS